MGRINRCRRGILRWRKKADLNSRDKIIRLKFSLEHELAKVYPSFPLMSKLKNDLAVAYKEEELFWRQKCREEWLKSGDRNTKFFHNCVKGKRHLNKILMHLDDLGQEHFSEGSKGSIAVDYFRELFMIYNPYDMESLFAGFQSRVTQEVNESLTSTVTEEEVKRAAFSIKSSSAPGQDGLTGVFYQRFWHIVGQSLTSEIQHFFATSILPDVWNHTQLSLIPKIIHPTKMSDMRPIACARFNIRLSPKSSVTD